MSPIGELVNPEPEKVVHHVSRKVSRFQLDGAVLELQRSRDGSEYTLTVSASNPARLQFGLGYLGSLLTTLAVDVAAGKR